ncbi:MAG: NUDIX domain-containing protein [Rhizobacter sp.]|nr:NUDIX domain-containing protein [Chlorobiales bacterium]
MQTDIGVIVGRFQVHELHQAHTELIESVMAEHKKVVMLLGVTSVLCSRRNPLDFVARKAMLLQKFPELTVLALPDMWSDKEWSKTLDHRLREACPVGTATLYGGRDSFIKYYSGAFATKELEPHAFISGTEVRKHVSVEVKASTDFRAGVIYAAYNQYQKVYPAVDVAVFKDDLLLLGKKPYQDRYRFIGGFADPGDASYEAAARREVKEEAGIEVDEVKYLGSARIDDWRYRSEADKILTLFFSAKLTEGQPQPQDDISELRWFKPETLTQNDLVPEHAVLFKLLKANSSR